MRRHIIIYNESHDGGLITISIVGHVSSSHRPVIDTQYLPCCCNHGLVVGRLLLTCGERLLASITWFIRNGPNQCSRSSPISSTIMFFLQSFVLPPLQPTSLLGFLHLQNNSSHSTWLMFNHTIVILSCRIGTNWSVAYTHIMRNIKTFPTSLSCFGGRKERWEIGLLHPPSSL